MGKYIPVEPEKWAEMVKALALVKEMDKTINASQAECRRLKAEVERLQNNCDYLDRELDREIDKTAMLCGQVERLRKAGDALAKRTEFFQKRWDADELCQEVEAWNAAKEGKQS